MEEDAIIFQKCITGGDGQTYCREVEAADVPVPTEPETETASDALSGPVTHVRGWIDPILEDPGAWAQDTLLQPAVILPISIQFGTILAALLAALVLAPFGKRLITLGARKLLDPPRGQLLASLRKLVMPVVLAAVLFAGETILANIGQPSTLVRIATSLAIAWALIRIVTALLPHSFRKPLAFIIWVCAILYAFGVLGAVFDWLSIIGPVFGGRTISPVFILQAVGTAALFLYGASWLSRQLKTRVDELPQVEPSIRILLGNALQVGLFFCAVLLTLAGLGIPLSGLAVLGGAIGIGLGFGMQQIVSNFVSGVILLSDRSIKPNDVIEVDEHVGVVKSLGLRYASVVTRDGTEHLIPNEMLVTDKVVNWSYSDRKVRLRRTLRIEYETDLELAVGLMEEGATKVSRVLSDPSPKGIVREFGEEAIEVEIRFWIEDPENGKSNVASDVLREIWKLFHAQGIDIPLRREEVLIEQGSTIKVEMVPGKSDG